MTNNSQNINLDRLRQSMPIIDLAKRLGLEVKNKMARCINSQAHSHNDKNFSMGFEVSKNRYKCFACGNQGSIIDLYMNVKGLDLKEAIKELASMTGISSETAETTPCQSVKVKDKDEVSIKEPNEDIYKELCEPLDKECVGYLTGQTRGLTKDTIKRFSISMLSDYRLSDKRLKDKFKFEELKNAGVLSDKGNLLFYGFKLLIPFKKNGKIVFLQSRRMDNEQPKYRHISRPVPIFNTDTLTEMNKGDKVYICEGVFDAMILEQNGYRAVAILGVNNFKDESIELFKGLDVVLCLDNDSAGLEATNKIAEMFLLQGQAVRSKQLPDGVKDVTDLFRVKNHDNGTETI